MYDTDMTFMTCLFSTQRTTIVPQEMLQDALLKDVKKTDDDWHHLQRQRQGTLEWNSNQYLTIRMEY